MTAIVSVTAIEILNSQGEPTIETTVILKDGSQGIASVPTGTSKGSKEAIELRDNNQLRYQGKGVLKAIEHVNVSLQNALQNKDALEQQARDQQLIELDGT